MCSPLDDQNMLQHYLFRHPSISRDYGNLLCMENVEQRLMWLRRPIWEWQSLPHWRQIQSVSCPAPWFGWFWNCLFASACCTSVSSKWERPWCIACLQAKHSDVKVSHLLKSIPKAFRSWLQLSLYHSCGLPLGAFPALILHTGDVFEYSHQPFSQHARANIDIAVSVMYTC